MHTGLLQGHVRSEHCAQLRTEMPINPGAHQQSVMARVNPKMDAARLEGAPQIEKVEAKFKARITKCIKEALPQFPEVEARIQTMLKET